MISIKLPGPGQYQQAASQDWSKRRTAMGEEQRNCTIYIALLVHEMDVQRFEAVDVYSGLEIWQLV